MELAERILLFPVESLRKTALNNADRGGINLRNDFGTRE